jgi:hypothetical protein
MMQKSTAFTTIFRVKKRYFQYDFSCTFITICNKFSATICEMFDELTSSENCSLLDNCKKILNLTESVCVFFFNTDRTKELP